MKRKIDSKNCIYCQEQGKFLFSSKGKSIYFCQNCKLGWVENFSAPNYAAYHRDSTYQICKPLFENIFQKLFNSIKPYFPKPGKMLDIGSSTGTVMELFQKNGWVCEGIEPSKDARSFATQKGLHIYQKQFEEINLPPKTYDLIFINHTLEHMDNPLNVFSKIENVIKDNGYLLVGVPNFGGIGSKILQNHWQSLLPSEHKWQFTKHSLNIIAKSYGFKEVKSFTTSGILDCDNILKGYIFTFKKLKKRFLWYLFSLPFSLLINTSHSGDNLVIIFRKEK